MTIFLRFRAVVGSSLVRAWLVFLGAVVVGGAVGPLVTDVLGISRVQLPGASGTLAATAGTAGALAAGLLAGRYLLRGEDRATLVRIPPAPAAVSWWPGPRLGAVALVAAPVLLVCGEALRLGHYFYYPDQLAATAVDPARMSASYASYTAGLLLLVPAVLAVAQLIGRELPGWAFWAATLAVIGDVVRIFHEGVNHLAMHLVAVQGLQETTDGITATYASWYVLYPLTFADNFGWPVLAIGAYRARVLGWAPALGLAVMHLHSSGVLKGSDLASMSQSAALCLALVPLGIKLWNYAGRLSGRTRFTAIAAVTALALLYAYHLLFVLPEST